MKKQWVREKLYVKIEKIEFVKFIDDFRDLYNGGLEYWKNVTSCGLRVTGCELRVSGLRVMSCGLEDFVGVRR